MDYTVQNSPGRNTGVGSLSLLSRIFPTQGSNPGLLHCGWLLYQLNHKGSPRILEWVAYSFSSGSSGPRNQTGVSCVAGGFFTNWAHQGSLAIGKADTIIHHNHRHTTKTEHELLKNKNYWKMKGVYNIKIWVFKKTAWIWTRQENKHLSAVAQ